MNSKYIDTTAIMQVIGTVFNTPQLLDYKDKYIFTDEDFPDEFHKIVFGSIHNIYNMGVEKITLNNVIDYLNTRPKYNEIFIRYKGEEWLTKISKQADSSAFDYYYNRMKKMTLLRTFDSFGVDVSFLYNPEEIFDVKKMQRQEEFLDNTPLDQLALKVQEKVDEVIGKCVNSSYGSARQAGDGVYDLIEDLIQHPEVGVPLYGKLINTVTRGARLKKFYLRSAASGVGKTRSMIADACYIACPKLYIENVGWVSNGFSEPVLYITTEQELSEIQTMMLAFLSNVDEEIILNGSYQGDQKERVLTAAKLLQESPLYIEELPDFSLQDIEDRIKRNIRDNDVKYVFNP